MKKFDRILNIVLGVAVVLFVADYLFLKETPATFDADDKDFAPVTLSKAHQETASASATSAPQGSAASTAMGGPEVAENTATPEAFTALSWEQLDAKVNADPSKPTLMVVFTSWCPFCKKLMPELVSLAATEKKRLNMVVISIDEDPNAIKGYISSLNPMPSFPVYLHASDNERSLIQAYLYKNQLNFTGGIPYMAIFNQGKPVKQFGGFVEKKVLTDILDGIEQQKNVNSGT